MKPALMLILLLAAGCTPQASEELMQEEMPETLPQEAAREHAAEREAAVAEASNEALPEEVQEKNVEHVRWQSVDGRWQALGTPPPCGEPLSIESPADISKATSFLYPGQERGGNYKAHGGIRFDNHEYDEIAVFAPADGVLLRGSRYSADGEVQYTFDIIDPCGILYRLGHLRFLSQKYAEIADSLPPAREGDTRTTMIPGGVAVESGELIATGIGMRGNPFFDFGMYDLRSMNEAAQDPAWLEQHPNELDPYAMCWPYLLPEEEEVRIWQLPAADMVSGDKSDYCVRNI